MLATGDRRPARGVEKVVSLFPRSPPSPFLAELLRPHILPLASWVPGLRAGRGGVNSGGTGWAHSTCRRRRRRRRRRWEGRGSGSRLGARSAPVWRGAARVAAAGLGAARGVRQGARRDGAGGAVWSGELVQGRARARVPNTSGRERRPLEPRGHIWSGGATAQLGPFEALGAPIWDLERGPCRAQLDQGRGAAAAQLDRRGRGRSWAAGRAEGREWPGTGAWDGAPERAGVRKGLVP